MATLSKWNTPETISTVHSTSLNALANGSFSAVSSAITNSTDLYFWMALYLHLASLTPTTGGAVNVYLLPAVDGTIYVDGGGSTAPPTETLCATFSLSTSASVKERARHGILIPPFDYKLVVENAAGVAFAGTLNTLGVRRYHEQQAP